MSAPQPVNLAASEQTPSSASAAHKTPRGWRQLAMPAAALLCILGALYEPRSPSIAGGKAGGFPVAEAMRNVIQLSRASHPIGAPQDAEVGNYIENYLEGIGLHPQIEQAVSLSRDEGVRFRAGNVRNILLRMPGTDSQGTVLLMAHYDSAVGSFGAADDGASVAALLQTIRVLGTRNRPKNDLLFLFTDGEEAGLLGAKAFAEENNPSGSIVAALNFEARGSAGPSLLFETGENDGWMVNQYLSAAPWPVAYSFVPALYRILPNNTDLTVIRSAGVPSLNFAFAEDWFSYHSALDNASRLDRSSLGHQGATALALAQRLGNTRIPIGDKKRIVYMNLFGPLAVSWSYGMAQVLAVLAVLGAVALIVVGMRTRRLRWRGLVAGALIPLVTAVIAVVVSGLIWWQVFGRSSVGQELIYHNHLDSVSLAFFAAALFALACWRFRKPDLPSWMTGAAVLWTILCALTGLLAPARSPPFTLGAFALLVSAFLLTRRADSESSSPALTKAAVLILCGAAVIVLIPVLRLLFAGLPGAEFLVTAPVVLVCTLLFPFFRDILATRRPILPLALLSIAVVLFAGAPAVSRPNARQPWSSSALYFADPEQNSYSWFVPGSHPDSWTEQFIAHATRADGAALLPDWYGSRTAWWQKGWKAQAGVSAEAAPEAYIEQKTSDAVNRTTARLVSHRHAPELWLRVESSTPILHASLNGRSLDNSVAVWVGRARRFNAPGGDVKNGFVLQIIGSAGSDPRVEWETASPFKGKVVLLDCSYSLPEGLYHPRTANSIPQRFVGDASIFIRRYPIS